MRNGFQIIDSHCHIYPEKIAAKAVAGTDTFYGTVAKCDGTADSLMKINEACGIDHSLVQSVATTPKQVNSINSFIAQTVAASDGKLTGLGTLHPDSEDQRADVQHLVDLGLRGVKLHPDIQRFKIDDYRCLKIYELCEEYGLPILMHTGDKRYDYSNTNRLIRLYDGCDGGKTGSTGEAGYCLAATAKRGEMRLLAVVLGCDGPYLSDTDTRYSFVDTAKLYDWAFESFRPSR